MSLLSWILFGVVTGLVSHRLDKTQSGGVLGAMLLGVLGSILGGVLSNLLLGIDIGGFNLTSLLIAGVGSLLLLFINRTLQRA